MASNRFEVERLTVAFSYKTYSSNLSVLFSTLKNHIYNVSDSKMLYFSIRNGCKKHIETNKPALVW